MKTKIFAATLLMILLVSPIAMAWGPYTHGYINKMAIDDPNFRGQIADTIRNYREYYDACFIASDITVWYYYTSGSRYEATHSWEFQEEFMSKATRPQEKACAYGIAAHLIQDSVSHNEFVPKKIRETYFPNFPGHVMAEGEIEVWVIDQHPDVFERYRNAMNVILNDPELMRKFDEAASSSGVINTEQLVRTLADVIGSEGGFYSKYFKLPEIYQGLATGNPIVGGVIIVIGGLIGVFKVYRPYKKEGKKRYFAAFIVVVLLTLGTMIATTGLVAIINIKDAQVYMDKSIERTQHIFTPQGWKDRRSYDPTGWGEIKQANKDVAWVWMIIFGVIATMITLAILRKRGKI